MFSFTKISNKGYKLLYLTRKQKEHFIFTQKFDHQASLKNNYSVKSNTACQKNPLNRLQEQFPKKSLCLIFY